MRMSQSGIAPEPPRDRSWAVALRVGPLLGTHGDHHRDKGKAFLVLAPRFRNSFLAGIGTTLQDVEEAKSKGLPSLPSGVKPRKGKL